MKILWANLSLLLVACLTFSGCSLVVPTSGVSTVTPAIDPGPILLPVKVSGKWGYVNTSGRFVITPQFDYAGEFHEGRARFRLASSYPETGFIDPSGKVVIAPLYGEAGDFSEGLAPVCRAAPQKPFRCGYIDRDEKFVIPYKFDMAYSFSEGLAKVCMGECHGNDGFGEQGGKFGFIDHSGHFVVDPQYDEVWDFKNGLAKVEVEKGGVPQTGYIDKTGKTIWQPSS